MFCCSRLGLINSVRGVSMRQPRRSLMERNSWDTGGEERRNRTRLTNLLWRQRYATGEITPGIPLLQDPNQHHHAAASETAEGQQPIQLQPKRMQDSYSQVVLPFSTDKLLREEYVNYYRGLRLGKLMEDLDALSASISYQHCHDGREGYLPLTIVTASVDRLDLLNPLRPDLDLKLHGHVTYVGKSSMEVTIRMESRGDPQSTGPIRDEQVPLPSDSGTTWFPIALCKFTMVARDPKTGQAARVNPLLLDTELQKRLAARGEENKRHKLEAAKRDLSREPPTPEERLEIHNLWLEQKQYEEPGADRSRIAYVQETKLQTVKLCHPQERNIHSAIFGGFLMREAFELAYTTAKLYLNGRPFTLSSDEIAFRKPVPIGSVLLLNAQVEYAEGEPHGTFQVSVRAEIENVAEETRELTNIFHYTFARSVTPDQDRLTEPKKRVLRLLPRTYGEAMAYLQGKRRKARGVELKKLQVSEFQEFPMPL